MGSILAKNPEVKIFTISSSAHMGIQEVLRECLQDTLLQAKQIANTPTESVSSAPESTSSEVPTISLSDKVMKDAWEIEKSDDKFIVKGEKIEKFARRTDLNNYASVNRLRDIMKKMGIRGELTSLGAQPDSIISIAGKEFTFVEDY